MLLRFHILLPQRLARLLVRRAEMAEFARILERQDTVQEIPLEHAALSKIAALTLMTAVPTWSAHAVQE